MSVWISVDEKMPPRDETAIAFGYGPAYGTVFPAQCVDIDRSRWLDLEEIDCDGEYDVTSHITHWMPLPPPPENKE